MTTPSPSVPRVGIIGAGLAGSECAWILAEHYGLAVTLYEMKPLAMTPAQCMPEAFAELVCSNSLKSTSLLNPAGILKTEMKALGSLIMAAAEGAKVPAGEALAVDREQFSGTITQRLRQHPRVRVHAETVNSLDLIRNRDALDHIVIATGPLTAGGLVEELRSLAGSINHDAFYFYDAIAPILVGSSVDRNIAFFASREDRQERQRGARRLQEGTAWEPSEEAPAGDYLNLPLNREQYFEFVERVKAGPKVPLHDFEEPRYFNGCQPIENLAESGPLTLAHGPMKGRGLTDPKTGRWAFAAVQLRKEKVGDDSYNMVGFQTRLTWTAQREIFRTLPGMADAEFHRMGSLHRNTYLCAPALLGQNFAFRSSPSVSLCGQIMGVEGYLESAAMGCLLGHTLGRALQNQPLPTPPPSTALGALNRYVVSADPKTYTPMNIHWGLFDGLAEADLQLSGAKENPSKATTAGSHLPKLDKATRRTLMSERASRDFVSWAQRSGLSLSQTLTRS